MVTGTSFGLQSNLSQKVLFWNRWRMKTEGDHLSKVHLEKHAIKMEAGKCTDWKATVP